MKNTIFSGDALDILPDFPPGAFQTVIADPPYFKVLDQDWDNQWPDTDAYMQWTEKWIKLCMNALKKDGLLFCFGQLGKREHFFLHVMSRLCMEWQFHDLIIWDRAVGYDRRDSFSPAYEMILVLRKGETAKFMKEAVREPYDPASIEAYRKDRRYKDKEARMKHLMLGKFSTNILRVPSLKGNSKEKVGHPSQKPQALIEKLILCSTDPKDVVLDPFIGSGTTAVAAEATERLWIGIEKDESYVSMANQRLRRSRDLFSESRAPDGAVASSVARR